MQTIGVRELKTRLSEILHQVQDTGEVVEVTHRGRTIARLSPVMPSRDGDTTNSDIWTSLDQLAVEIGPAWPPEVGAVEAVRNVRRAL